MNLLKSAVNLMRRPLLRYNSAFLNGTSSQYLEQMYNSWMENPSSVHASWDSYFRMSQQGVENAYQSPPSLAVPGPNEIPLSRLGGAAAGTDGTTSALNEQIIDDHLAVQGVIRSYQARGHLVAQLDPLDIMYSDKTTTISDRLGAPPGEITTWRKNNLAGAMDRVFKLPTSTFIGGQEKQLPLKEILRRLELVYCRHIGAEFMKISSMEERDWCREQLETPGKLNISSDLKKLTLHRLVKATAFESFLAKKWPSEKRFGLEGCEVLIPAIKQIIDRSSALGVDTIVIGLAHRGRLNTLANICEKPLKDIFTQFHTVEATDTGSGDVKYHLGTYIERLNEATEKNVRLILIANPSHLEAVDPVVQGRTRAEQFYRGDREGKRTMSVLIHGDASFCGQGVVYETIHLADLPCYTTHGTIHVIVNNQVGFTTDPRFHRSSPYCTDVGHVVDSPIFHVNSDDPENVMFLSNLAADWRHTFHKDIFIDIVCYRRNGHNESDEPMFTQPIMYTKIKSQPPILKKYTEELVKEGIIKQEEVDEWIKSYMDLCEAEFQKASKETKMLFKDWIDSPWSGFLEGKGALKIDKTGIPEETLLHIVKRFSQPPPESLKFVIHKGIERILNGRAEMVKNRTTDWAMGEALTFGSLLKQGIHVRLSGQDVERGTFSHRHNIVHHQTIDKVTYNFLAGLYPDQAPYIVCNSSLSEYGVAGFELGYAMANPNALVMWEAQFGDFSNNAQVIFDQFLSSGEAKWVRQSGLVILLPHGMEGMGPEHSSCRPERFLQMCADEEHVFPPPSPDFALTQLEKCNWIVANCTCPANFFHLLRRQIALPFRKPLILFTPKSLLRHPEARSPFGDYLEGTEFRRIIPDASEANKHPKDVKKLIFCTGKVYFELTKERKKRTLDKDIAITRIEQLSPFPFDLVKAECDKYPEACVVWSQEEHRNMGGWHYVKPRFATALGSRKVSYAGRPAAASPATGSKFQYIHEVEKFVNDTLAI